MSLIRNVITLGAFAAAAGIAIAGCSITPEGAKVVERSQALEEGETCLVGAEVVEHSCNHASFGPFASVTAQAYPGFVFSDINAVHTAFTVDLPASGGAHQGAVLYQPTLTGGYAFLLAPGATITVYDSSSQPVPMVGTEAVDPAACAALDTVTVFQLSETETYTVVFGPTESASVQTIVEFIGEGGCDACSHVDLDASVSYRPLSWQVGEANLDHHIEFEIPAEIPVIEGNSGNHWARLKFSEGGGPFVSCWYRGGANVPVPISPAQLALATRYEFHSCNNGMSAGDIAEADTFRLRVLFGGNPFPGQRTAVELEIEPLSCHEHEESP